MFCKECGTQIDEGAEFCPNCGEKVVVENEENTAVPVEPDKAEPEKTVSKEETDQTAEEIKPTVQDAEPMQAGVKYCHACGAENAADVQFCHECGAFLDADDADAQSTAKPNKKTNKGIFAIAGIAVAAVCVVAIIAGIALKSSSSKAKETLLYLKDNELVGLKGSNTYVVDSNVYSDEDDADDFYTYGSGAGAYVTVSDDGKYIYYPRKYENGVFDLYYKKVGNQKDDGVKIASSITRYYVLDNGNVIYFDGTYSDGGKLYLYNSKKDDKDKIASDVKVFYLSEDEKLVAWRSTDDKLYYCDTALKNDKTKLDSDVTRLIYRSDDLKKLVYYKDDALYLLTNFEDKTKIASDVSNAYVSEDGNNINITYLRYEDEGGISWMDLIYDDLADSDKSMSEPNIGDYQHVETGLWGYSRTVTDDAYYDALEEYYNKESRDTEREEWEEYTYSGRYATIYSYDPKNDESNKVFEGVIEDCSNSPDNDILFFVAINEDAIEKVNFSDINDADYDQRTNLLREAYVSAAELYMLKDGKQTQVDADLEEYGTNVYALSSSDKLCYFTLSKETNTDIALFSASSDKSDGKTKILTYEYGGSYLTTDDGIYYLEDAENGIGDLYFNDNKVDSDVEGGTLTSLKKASGILYCADYDDDKDSATLYIYEGSKSTKISDDVGSFCVGSKDSVAMLVDYSVKRHEGDLKVFKNNKLISIDDDVTAILNY